MTGQAPERATWFKFFGQRYLVGGSLRAECPPAMRAVWLDFLCLANQGAGRFDCANRDALAAQLLIPRDLLDESIGRFTETGRLKINYDKAERKEVFIIVKWAYYQAPTRRHRPAENPPPSPPLKKEKRERERERERRGSIRGADFLKKGSNCGAELSPLPPIPPDFPFKVKDALRELGAEIKSLERLKSDPKARQQRGLSENELSAKIQNERRTYVRAIEDRKD